MSNTNMCAYLRETTCFCQCIIYVLPIQVLMQLVERLEEGWWLSVVVSTLALFNEVNRHWARLVLGRVTVYGQVNHLGIWPAT